MNLLQQQRLNPIVHANRDLIVGAPGSQSIGIRLGAIVGGMAAGAVWATVVGPVGTLVSAALGALYGGIAGKGIAEMIDPPVENSYWRETCSGRPSVATRAT